MNIIRVKIIKDGEPTGRAYTYKSDINVKQGDLVSADMGGSEKTLIVVETGIPASEIEGLDYEIETITGLAADRAEEPQEEMDFRVTNEVMPVIEINETEMKAALSAMLENYTGIVVTETNLSQCKATQKQLAGMKRKIDEFRKDRKRKLQEPIVKFEAQCKDLIAMIEQVEAPIKVGITGFDDQKRQKKREAAEEAIKEVAAETGLREKYAKQLTVIDKYCNLGAQINDVKDDLSSRAMALRVEQDREDELLEIIKDCIDTENKRLTTKLSLDDYKTMIDRGMPTKDILATIKQQAQKIYDSEHPTPKEPPAEPVQIPPSTTVIEAPVEQSAEDPDCFAVYRVTGKLSQLKALSAYLKQSGITYKVAEQGMIE